MEKYLGKINTVIAEANLSFAVNFNYQVFSVFDSPIPPRTSTPTFDSELGIEIDTAMITVIPEIPEHLFYLMQWLRIRCTNHLIFFDKGANAHLVQGKMAVAAGFEITSSRPTSLTVVVGGNLKTEYGSYQFNLGPGAGGSTMRFCVLVWIPSHLSSINTIYLTSALNLFLCLILINLFHHYPNMWGVLKYICFLE